MAASGNHDVQALDDAVFHVVGDFDAVARNRRSVRLADRRVAFGDDDARFLIVGQLVGDQRALAVGDLDVAFGRDDVRVGVVGHLVGADENFLLLFAFDGRERARSRQALEAAQTSARAPPPKRRSLKLKSQ